MYCKKCGSALPSHGFICKNCGALMNNKQIGRQKKFMNENEKKNEVKFLSDMYRDEPLNRNFKENKKIGENKFLGAIFIVLVLIILIIIAILKVI